MIKTTIYRVEYNNVVTFISAINENDLLFKMAVMHIREDSAKVKVYLKEVYQ